MCDVYGRILDQKCPSSKCKAHFEPEITYIAPMTIVGPVSHGNLGKDIWVCASHWDTSVHCGYDHILAKEALLIEASDVEKQVAWDKARKVLDFTEKKDSIDDIFDTQDDSQFPAIVR